MSEEEKQEKKFEVKDKRRFTGDGGERKEEAPRKESPEETPAEKDGGSPSKEPEEAQEQSAGGKAPEEKKPPADLPPINFATFVVSLSSSVLIHLGLAPDPVSGETRKELSVAKQTIDILSMLKDKTKGNLAKEEDQLMESILYDLRMRYVEEVKKG